jgi:Ala-tRNA(Pro) deacylase
MAGGMSDGPDQVYSALDALGIPFQRYDHPPVFTGEDAALHWAAIPARGMKNLFLRNKKGNRHYLVILPIEKEADLRRLVKVIGDDRFSFGSPERLAEHLGVAPGSVSPFGLLNNPSHSVQVVVDAELRGGRPLIFHPNLNSHSVTISVEDLERFLASTGHSVRWMSL